MAYEEYDYKSIAELVARKLDKKELLGLAILLDSDAGNDFNHFIQREAYKVAPELFVHPEIFETAQEAMNPKKKERE